MAEARRQLAAAKRADSEAEIERQLEAREARLRECRAKVGYGVPAVPDYDGVSVADLEAKAKEKADNIANMAAKCGNIKGTIL